MIVSSTQSWLESVQYGNFRLKEFCDRGAMLAKLLITARERQDKGFLGDAEDYQDWKLDQIAEDLRPTSKLLYNISILDNLLQRQMIDMGGSGGVAVDDPLGEFKMAVAALVDQLELEIAIEKASKSFRIDWESLAAWETLPNIRVGLNEVYKRLELPESNVAVPDGSVVAQSSRVKLFSFSDDPVALVDSNAIRRLTQPQYDVVKALLLWPDGLSKKDLQSKTGHGDALGILKRLQKKEHWKYVIDLPGSSHRGYRIH